jgi:hypothetical protein
LVVAGGGLVAAVAAVVAIGAAGLAGLAFAVGGLGWAMWRLRRASRRLPVVLSLDRASRAAVDACRELGEMSDARPTSRAARTGPRHSRAPGAAVSARPG